jgi:hypothetical protein
MMFWAGAIAGFCVAALAAAVGAIWHVRDYSKEWERRLEENNEQD